MPVDLSAAQQEVPVEAPVTATNVAGGSSPPENLSSVDLADVPRVTPPPAPVDPPSYVVAAGVTLVKWVLVIMSVFVVLTVIWIWWSENDYARQMDDLLMPAVVLSKGVKDVKEVADPILKEHADFREFWLKIFQMVLLNVLLPVLTALLGYIFSSSRDQSKA